VMASARLSVASAHEFCTFMLTASAKTANICITGPGDAEQGACLWRLRSGPEPMSEEEDEELATTHTVEQDSSPSPAATPPTSGSRSPTG
jgi:hypothetical protein